MAKVDPLNRERYAAVTVMLTVSDINAAIEFYERAFGFKRRDVFTGHDGKPFHAELTLRDTHLMLTPEVAGSRSARNLRGSPSIMYLLVENVDEVTSNAIKHGATPVGQFSEVSGKHDEGGRRTYSFVEDMYWGDRRGHVVDPDGYDWMVATHVADPKEEEMRSKRKEWWAAQKVRE